MKKILAWTALPLLLSGGVTQAGGLSAEALAYTCAGCHGTDGSSVGPASPHIASLDAEYFVDAMKAYKADERNATIMDRVAKSYTEEQFEKMAEFFARQPLRLRAQAHDAAKAQAGKNHHKQYCADCHGERGRDTETGLLGGQWKPYLYMSMKDYLTGARDMPKEMARETRALREEHGNSALDAVIHYYSSQE